MRHLKSAARPARKNLFIAFLLFLCASVFLIAPSLPTVMGEPNSPDTVPVIAPGSAYRQTNLVSDSPGVGTIQDPLLVNPWGISMAATSPFWVANAGTSTATLYRETASTPFVKNPGTSFVNIPGGLPTLRRVTSSCPAPVPAHLVGRIFSLPRSRATSADGIRTPRRQVPPRP